MRRGTRPGGSDLHAGATVLLRWLDCGILHTITFRAAMAAVFAFLLGLAAGPPMIALLRRKKIGERVEKGDSARLDALHAAKKDTPTMGGVLILGSALIGSLLFARPDAFFVQLTAFTVIALAAIGAADDLRKLASRGKGLGIRKKLALQCAVGIAVGIALQVHHENFEFRAEALSADEIGAYDVDVVSIAQGTPALTAVAPLREWPAPKNLVQGTALYVPFFTDVRIGLGLGMVLDRKSVV